MLVVLSCLALLSVESIRTSIENVATTASFAAWDNWASICLLAGGTGLTCALACMINSSVVMSMFFSSNNSAKATKQQPSVRWSLFRAFNWACSWVFLWSLTQLWPTVAARSSNNPNTVPVDKVALLSCFATLTYLLSFFGVSLVYADLDATAVADGKKVQSSGSGSIVGTLLSVVYFAGAMAFVATMDSSLLGLAATTGAAILGSVVLLRPAAENDERTFDATSSLGGLLNNQDSVLGKGAVDSAMAEYEDLFSGAREETGAITSDESIEKRKAKYDTMVNTFYNVVTDFYEYGWGQSFHFAPRFVGETFDESIKRAEHHLAHKLGLHEDSKVLDCGCGVGGPMRNIARFTDCTIDGLTINQYQVNVGNKYNVAQGLPKCRLYQGDFMAIPFEPRTYDAAYCIESTCHAPSKRGVFSQVNRVLKMGGLITGYEWVMLNGYDPTNARHVELKEGIEVGNGLPTLATPQDVVDELEAAGFEIVEHYDANRNQFAANNIPWFDTLNGKMTLKGFRMTNIGRNCTHTMVRVLEALRIAPKGSVRVSEMLNATAIDLVEAGKDQLFTPSYFFLARKVREVLPSE